MIKKEKEEKEGERNKEGRGGKKGMDEQRGQHCLFLLTRLAHEGLTHGLELSERAQVAEEGPARTHMAYHTQERVDCLTHKKRALLSVAG